MKMDIKEIDKNMADAKNTIKTKVKWYNLHNSYLRGMGFFSDKILDYDRLKRGVSISQGVDNLKKCHWS